MESGSADFTLTVRGNYFVPQSVVQWNNSNRTTTFVSATELRTTIRASDVATSGQASVKVVYPVVGSSSATLAFTITNPVPITASISPNAKTVYDADFTLTLNGINAIESFDLLLTI